MRLLRRARCSTPRARLWFGAIRFAASSCESTGSDSNSPPVALGAMRSEKEPQGALCVERLRETEVSDMLLRTCVVSVLTYCFCCYVFAATVERERERDPAIFRTFSACTGSGFLATALMSLIQVGTQSIDQVLSPSVVDDSADDDKAAQKRKGWLGCLPHRGGLPVTLCIMVINVIACATHFMMALEVMPVVRALGRRHHTVRWAEWIALIPLMMMLIHAYDVEPGLEQRRDRVQPRTKLRYFRLTQRLVTCVTDNAYAVVSPCTQALEHLVFPHRDATGALVLSQEAMRSVYCQTWSTALGAIATLYQMPAWLVGLLLVLSSTLFLNIFCVLFRSYGELSPRFQPGKVEPRDFEVEGTPKRARSNSHRLLNRSPRHLDEATIQWSSQVTTESLSKLHEFKLRKIRAFILITVCSVLWSLIVLNYFAGLLGLYPKLTEAIVYNCTDVLSKNLFMSTLGQAHAKMSARLTALKTQLVVEQKATEKRRQFLRYVMHEVRVPLNAVKLGLTSIADSLFGCLDEPNDMVQNDSIGKESHLSRSGVEGIVDVVNRSIDSMSETLNDVLSFAAIEEGRFVLHGEPFDIATMLSKIVATHLPTANEKEIALTTYVEDALSRVRLFGDHRRIGACVSNFVSNALKFDRDIQDKKVEIIATATGRSVAADADVMLPPGSRGADKQEEGLSLTHSRKADNSEDGLKAIEVLLEVKDNGIGLSDSDRHRLFTAFSQIRPGELQEGRGSGLGLAIAKSIVQKHGGRVGVKSALHVGSTFYLSLPLAIVEDEVVSPQPKKAQLTPSKKNSGPSKAMSIKYRALVVDDALSNRKLFTMQVEKHGLTTCEAANGAEALTACGVDLQTGSLDTLPSVPFDVIFMDSVMPILDGLEATRRLRAAGCEAIVIGVSCPAEA